MKLFWSFLLCLCGIHMSCALHEKILKMLPIPIQIPKPGGILEALTKPKLPSGNGFQLGSHFGTNGGGGSFGFGFGFGGQFGTSSRPGLNLPPNEKQPVKPDSTWEEDKKKVGSRPNKGEDHPKWEDERPKWEEDEKEDHPSKHENMNEGNKKDAVPDWEEIGEIDKDPKSEYLMDGELVNDGLIQPRLNRNRGKRYIGSKESKIYHVPLTFRSNAKPYQVKIQRNPNSLLKGNSQK